jgi:uncharacterized protein YbjT (DUF2867 family)
LENILKVLAVGAAGSSAGSVVRALTARGIAVRGLVHSEEKEDVARRNGAVETVIADLTDIDSLSEAVAGVDGVFHIIPAFVPDEVSAGVTLVRAAEEARVKRFVFSSVYHPSLTNLSNHRDKMPAERAIYDSAMEFTVLQPAMFMAQLVGVSAQAQGSGVITGPYSSNSSMSYVDYRDVAEVAALAFTTDRFMNGTFELAAPGMFSRTDLAKLLTELIGRPVRADSSPPVVPAGSGMPPAMREGLNQMFAHYDEHGFHGGNSLVLESMLGRPPTTVPEYLAQLFGDDR